MVKVVTGISGSREIARGVMLIYFLFSFYHDEQSHLWRDTATQNNDDRLTLPAQERIEEMETHS